MFWLYKIFIKLVVINNVVKLNKHCVTFGCQMSVFRRTDVSFYIAKNNVKNIMKI